VRKTLFFHPCQATDQPWCWDEHRLMLSLAALPAVLDSFAARAALKTKVWSLGLSQGPSSLCTFEDLGEKSERPRSLP
jgi:hypothetical protein